MTAAANAEFAIDVHGLNKHYGEKHVVRDVSLRVRRGEIFGFLGPNGSGKTTTIRMVCGLLKPDSGSGACLGHDIVRERAQIKRKVGYMTQRFSFWEDLSIAENLDFVARMYEIPQRKAAVRRALETLGLASRARQLAGALSGGWKQTHGARGLHVARAQSAPARRTHGRRRSPRAARLLGRVAEPGGAGHFGSGEHALYG